MIVGPHKDYGAIDLLVNIANGVALLLHTEKYL